MQARIRRLRPDIPLPAYKTPESAGFDLAAAEGVVVPPGEVRLVPTGLSIEAPEGCFLALCIRSSTPLKRGLMLANGIGIVDRDYSGPTDEVLIEVFNFTTRPVQVNRGERIAQGLFLNVVRAEWVPADALRDRSRGGFGSSGS